MSSSASLKASSASPPQPPTSIADAVRLLDSTTNLTLERVNEAIDRLSVKTKGLRVERESRICAEASGIANAVSAPLVNDLLVMAARLEVAISRLATFVEDVEETLL